MLTGKPPFYGKTEKEIYLKISSGNINQKAMSDLSKDATNLIMGLLSQNVENWLELS